MEINISTVHNAFLMDPVTEYKLSPYGKVLFEYQGEGAVILTNGQKYRCKFRGGQLSNADIILICSLNLEEGQTLNFSDIPGEKFEGITIDGYRVTSDKILAEINDLTGSLQDEFPLALYLVDLHVKMKDDYLKSTKITFGLANFEFTETDRDNKLLPLDHHPFEKLYIEKCTDYPDTIRRVKTLHGIDITSSISIEPKDTCEIQQVTDFCNRLCALLSIARGTKAQWVYYEQYSSTGELLSRSHYRTVTRPYSPASGVIDGSFIAKNRTKKFIECALKKTGEDLEYFNLLYPIINTYIEAKRRTYLEIKGQNIVITLEMLKNFALNHSKFGISESILPGNTFSGIRKEMEEIICRSVSDKNKKLFMYNNLQALNRTSFRQILALMCDKIGLRTDEIEMRYLMKSRNSLVHTGRFFANSLSEEDLKERKCPYHNQHQEHYFLINFLDKMFLKLMGYHGRYFNSHLNRDEILE